MFDIQILFYFMKYIMQIHQKTFFLSIVLGIADSSTYSEQITKVLNVL